LITEHSPRASYEQAEALRLAFLACVQLLPARQRAIFLLHEVLGWSAAEVADAFAISPQAANSQLQRARRTFDLTYQQQPKWTAASENDQQLAERYATALTNRDLDAFAALLDPDAELHMPPWRAWVKGRDAVRSFNSMIWQRYNGFRVRIIRANGCYAFTTYANTSAGATWLPHSVHVLEFNEGVITSIIAFVGPLGSALFSRAGLPLHPGADEDRDQAQDA
jgi:RNA polymerase sigma-70 factor (ECF subfamily)